ncbi:MAG: hypothetical protein Q8Q41_00960 [bacterium]|nr:hypothetical protein [bacterium]
MKKVLIVGYFRPYFPYGSARVPGLAKYLREFGWQPVILTPLKTQPPADDRFGIAQTPYPGDVLSPARKLLAFLGLSRRESGITEELKGKIGAHGTKTVVERLRDLYLELFAYPDSEKKWRRPALATARAFLNHEPADALLSVWPVTSHLIAKELKSEYQLPWIADFPDPWSENHAYYYGRIRKWLDWRLERRTLSDADALTAAAPTYAKKESAVTGRPCETILHGFEPEKINRAEPPHTEKLTIAYTGTIYRGYQDPTKLLDAITSLSEANLIKKERIEVNFYGRDQDWLAEEIRTRHLEKTVKIHGLISREEAIARQHASQLLLMFGWESKKEVGGIPYKMYEYLAARRPILITGGFPQDDMVRIIASLHGGVHAPTIADIKTALLGFYEKHRSAGILLAKSKLEDIEKLSYREMARKFAAILDRIYSKTPRELDSTTD